MADLENGLWACSEPRTAYPKNTHVTAEFVTAMVKGDRANHWAIKSGDAQAGELSTLYDGERPPGYHPMKKQGAIILGENALFCASPVTHQSSSSYALYLLS
jgi:hypothetical protein